MCEKLKNEIIQKLADERGDVRSCGKGQPAVGVTAEGPADEPVEGVVQQSRGQEGHGTAQEDEPRASEDTVKGGEVPCVGGNGGGNEEDGAGEEVDATGQDRHAVGCARAEVLGDDVHAHEGQPGDEDTAVQGDPGELEKGLVGQKVHADDRHHEEGHHRGGDGAHEDLGIGVFTAEP